MKKILSALLAMAVTSTLHSAYADPSAQEYNFELARQPLEATLKEFSKQTGLNTSFVRKSRNQKEIVVGPLKGRYTAGAALGELLAETGLTFEQTNDVSIAVTKPRVKHRNTSLRFTRTATQSEAELAGMGLAGVAAGAQGSAEDKEKQASDESEPSDGEQSQNRAEGDRDFGIPEILVAGTRILNMDIKRSRDDAQPYMVFDRKAIAEAGANSVEEFLRQRLTANTSGISLSQSSAFNQSRVNLRGLGSNQTLILVDGRRAAATVSTGGTPQQPDLNGIPLAAVERIEILPTTASGIYGGSATGGVVNVVLRRDYSGIETRVSYENSFDSDSSVRRADLSAGFPFENGNSSILAAFSYSDGKSMQAKDRDFLDRARATILRNNPTSFSSSIIPPLGETPNIHSANGSPLFGPGTPNFTSVPVGYAGGGGLAPLQANAGRYNLNLADTAHQSSGGGAQSLTNEPTVKAGMVTLRRRFGSWLDAFMELSASKNSGEFTYSITGPLVTVASTAPNNPFGQTVLVSVPIDDGRSAEIVDSEVRRAVGGVVVRLPRNWSAGADFTWSTSRLTLTDSPASGITAAGAAAILNGTIDVLRDLTSFPSDLSAFLAPAARQSPVKSKIQDGVLRAAGPVGSLFGGTPTLSALIEHRREFTDESQTITINSNTIFPSKSLTVKSAYAEARLPLVSTDRAHAGLRELELQLAVRHDEYTADGAPSVLQGVPIVRAQNKTTSTDPTIALRYMPVRDLVLRGSFGTGFLPPSVTQLAPSRSTRSSTVVDPRRGGTPITLPVGQVFIGGNADLEPENSESWSVGIILTPSALSGLRLSVDYTRIRKSDEIRNPFGNDQDVVNRESLFPDLVVRAAPSPGDPFGVGPITEIRRTLINVAHTELEAIDAAFDLRLPTSTMGAFSVYALATWQPHFRQQLISTASFTEGVGVGSANPLRFKGNAGISWEYGAWNLGWSSRYFDSYRVADPTLAFNLTTIANQGGDGRIPSQIYHDVFATYRFGVESTSRGSSLLDATELRLGARNIFNKEPPFDAFDTVRHYSPHGDPRLATYYLSITKQF